MKKTILLIFLLIALSPVLLSKPPRKVILQEGGTKVSVSEGREPYSQIVGGSYASTLPQQNVLVLLVQFSDVKFGFSKSKFEDLLNGSDRSVCAYLGEQFSGTRTFRYDVRDVVTVNNPLSWYGGNDDQGRDMHPRELVSEACALADAQTDFSKYDADGDGLVDLVAVFVAGKDEADSGIDYCLWSHSWEIYSSGLANTFDGVKVGNYILTTELTSLDDGTFGMATIGAFCHEFSHYLGLKDLYDSDYEKSGGQTVGVWGQTSLMDSGCYSDDGRTPPPYNAVELDCLGTGDCRVLKQGSVNLSPLVSSHSYFKAETGNEDIFYLMEYRSGESWDKYSGGTGMLVYRVDKSNSDAGYSTGLDRNVTAAERWDVNQVNCNPDYMCARILEASKPEQSYEDARRNGQIQSIFYPGPSGKYDSLILDGTGLSISSIKKESNQMSFSVNGLITYSGADIFQDSAIFKWHVDQAEDSGIPVRFVLNKQGKTSEYEVLPYGGGKYALNVDGLESDAEYEFTIVLPEYYGKGTEYSGSIHTMPRLGEYPYIYLDTADRYISGAFRPGSIIPLKLINLVDAESVEWSMDGAPIATDKTGYYKIMSSGVLMAIVHYKDGSEEKIIKNITVK